jgi:hypothetical protein
MSTGRVCCTSGLIVLAIEDDFAEEWLEWDSTELPVMDDLAVWKESLMDEGSMLDQLTQGKSLIRQ